MNYRYVLLEIAQQEYDSAIEWYASRSVKAAENLVTEVENTLQLICNNPGRWRSVYKHYKELGIRRYPFVIVYFIEEDLKLVVITAIFHAKRNPRKKYRKE